VEIKFIKTPWFLGAALCTGVAKGGIPPPPPPPAVGTTSQRPPSPKGRARAGRPGGVFAAPCSAALHPSSEVLLEEAEVLGGDQASQQAYLLTASGADTSQVVAC
jgi:hypothetical protein